MLARIIDSDEDRSVPTLRSLSYGGAPMPAALIERALREWTGVGFVNAYGLTETSSTVALLGPDDHRAAIESDDRRCGRGSPRSAARCQGSNWKSAARPANCSASASRAGSACAAARCRPSTPAWAARSTTRASSTPGTTATSTPTGYLFISGRTDDTIIRGAENIAPAEIEDVLLRHPAVLDAVVFGVPDQEWGQRIEAAVVPRPETDLDPADLRAFTLRALRSSKTPDRFWLLRELPRTETASSCAGWCPA